MKPEEAEAPKVEEPAETGKKAGKKGDKKEKKPTGAALLALKALEKQRE